MEKLTDSSETTTTTTRSPLGIDLNKIPTSSSSSPPLPPTPQHGPERSDSNSDLREPESLDVVRSFHEDVDPAAGIAAGIPEEERGFLLCGSCEKPEVEGQVVVCDGCERGFHLACAGIGGAAASLVDWLCRECQSGGVKSKRWPLGLRSKRTVLDINSSPPSDSDGTSELLNLRNHASSDNSSGGNLSVAPATYSKLLYAGNGLGFKKDSGLMMHAFRVGFEDILHHTQAVDRSLEEIDISFPLGRCRSSSSSNNNNTDVRLLSRNPSEILLQGLREFISERHGILEEGWRVEIKQLHAVYCSPDGKTFGSMFEVACHLGLMPNCNSMDADGRSDGSPSVQEKLHLPNKRKSKRFSLANGFAENKETLVSGYHKELLSKGQSKEVIDAKIGEVAEAEMGEGYVTKSEPSMEVLPVQFEDFFVLSLGKIDMRPSYHDVSLIWPVGYRSCWHDKITGSLFMCEVSDGGDSGPLFKIRRFSCSALPVPQGSTFLYRTKLGQFAGQNKKDKSNLVCYSMDCENDSNIEIILEDPTPPTECDILTCLSSGSNESSGVQMSDTLQTGFLCSRSENFISSNVELEDEIGEISVEDRSSAAAWKMVSQKLIDAYSQICKRRGTLKFGCNHVGNGRGSPNWDANDEKSKPSFSSLAKFCGSSSVVSIPSEYQGEPDSLAAALSKWLDQDRFGLDTEFVQEIIEKLPGVEACSKHEFLTGRGHYSASLTVGNGLLVAKRRSEVESNDSFRGSKKRRFVEDLVANDRDPPPGRLLCSRLPPMLVGDLYQIWELLLRFHEILGLEEPFLLEELEEEVIEMGFDGSILLDNSEREVHGSQVLDLHGGQISSSCEESRMAVCGHNSHVFVQVETGVIKDAAQTRLASAAHGRCTGVLLAKAHSSLLRVLISELQSKVAALVDPNFDSGESKSKRGRKKDADSSLPLRRSKLSMLPVNELTWPELARRYILAVLSMDGNLDSAETTARQSGKVFCCLQGDGGLLCGSLTGVAGMEADALLLAEATKQIFGLSRENDVFTMEEEATDASSSCEKNNLNDGKIPEWAQLLEPVRKLPTNVGTRIRKCVYSALEKCPPEWAKKRLEHSISKEVFKGNASGPTKKAVLSVLADVLSDGMRQKSETRNKKKIVIPTSDIIMKKCRIVLRLAAAADDEKVFCTLLGRNLINSCDNDDEGLLGSPAMVSRPLDFRTIDLRLAVGAYAGSHESFLEDVRELWNNVCIAFGDQADLVELAGTLSQNFESLFEKEVVAIVQKFEGYAKLDHISAETKKELDDVIASVNEIPKAPWDEGVCKVCGVDKDDDSVLLCDTCDAEYHTYCLNPPLARIPEGNWYCPSCVIGVHKAQGASETTDVIGRSLCKKYQGEVTHAYLETLTHLAVGMEGKEYWEFSVDERIFLLKFLCDELLNSALIRQHLEQCMETTAELMQKLRLFSVEWKNLKSKEEFLASRVAKMDANAVRGGTEEGPATALATQSKCVGQSPDVSNRPTHCSTFSGDLPALEVGQEGTGINGFHKCSSVTNSDEKHSYKSQTVNLVDTESQVNDILAVVDDSKIPSLETYNSLRANQLSPSNHLQQVIDDPSEIQCQGNLQGSVGRETSALGLPSDHQAFCLSSDLNIHAAQHTPPLVMNESQAHHLELSTIRNDILHLQNSINSIESQLLKLSVRREFLGTDSRGRLYWASVTASGHPRIVVDGSMALQQRKKSDHRDTMDDNSVLLNCASSGLNTCSKLEGSKACFPFPCKKDDMAIYLPWLSYETDKEIEELIGWLNDHNRKERELKESILQWMKVWFQETQQTRSMVQEEHQATSSIITNNGKTVLSDGLVTKASMILEKKYGSFIELDTFEMLKKRGKKARVAGEEKMYRCNCLEPIWPSRHHCLSCHRTFANDVEFGVHNNGRCNLARPAHKKSDEIIESVKAKGSVKSEATQEECISEMDVLESSNSGWSGLSSSLIKFQNEGIVCPYDFEEIGAKFVTQDSNRELVQEIGLIGSNGTPSFIRAISPYLDDSTIMLISSQKDASVPGDEFNVGKRAVILQGNGNETNSGHQSILDNSSKKSATVEISKLFKANKPSSGCLEHKGRKTPLDKLFPEMGAGCCCVVPQSSLRPLVGKIPHILRKLKINLLDMEAALPEEALRPSRVLLERTWAWRGFVKSAESIYEMVQATIILEEMIKTAYLRNERWYWSSLSAAANTSTVSSLALRIYSLDAAIVYERNLSNSDLKPGSILDQKSLPGLDPVDRWRVTRKSNKKRKEPEV